MGLRAILWLSVATVAAVAAGALFVTSPATLPAVLFTGLVGDSTRGENVFWAGGCAACHASVDAQGDEKFKLGGGQRFPSPYGTFVAPNISPDRTNGIGTWGLEEFANAVMRGTSPDGRHYFPVFPYASYQHADLQDVADLYAFLRTLPAVSQVNEPSEIRFPFSVRRLIGVWKYLYLDDSWVVHGDLNAAQLRGRYLVEALGHCGECHTPRNALGALDRSRWLQGGPVPGGPGKFPAITPAELTWTEAEIVEYLTTGFTPDYDSAGGHMALVVENTAHLSAADRAAIAAYLKIVLATPGPQ